MTTLLHGPAPTSIADVRLGSVARLTPVRSHGRRAFFATSRQHGLRLRRPGHQPVFVVSQLRVDHDCRPSHVQRAADGGDVTASHGSQKVRLGLDRGRRRALRQVQERAPRAAGLA
jgi:hypothetical protein